MIASRVLYNKQNKASNEDVWFRQDVRAIFTGINELMKKTDAQFRGAQSNALKNFGSIISKEFSMNFQNLRENYVDWYPYCFFLENSKKFLELM